MRIMALFVDIGGVLLTDGWEHEARERAAKAFDLDFAEMESRHRAAFETYELGKLTVAEYLNLVVFYEARTFTISQFWTFMTEQSQPFPQMINLIAQLKARHGLKIAVVSNEARDLNAYRIETFKLATFVDFFVSSCFVHMRKPDPDMFRLTLDLAQTPASHVAYIDDRQMFVGIAAALGIHGIHHTDYISTRAKLAALGLVCPDSESEPS